MAGEEIVQQAPALVGEDPADDLGAVVETAVADHVPEGADGPRLQIDRPVNEPVDPREHDRPLGRSDRHRSHPVSPVRGHPADDKEFSEAVSPSAEDASDVVVEDKRGFEVCGTLPQVGAKFGRWLDLVYVQYLLDRAPEPPRT